MSRSEVQTKRYRIIACCLKPQIIASVNYLQFNRINTDGIASLISNSSGNLNVINASNIIYINAFSQFPFYLNNDKNEVKALTVSNFYGSGAD